jgi:riboflavin biosynthesis pyrimidine reductase
MSKLRADGFTLSLDGFGAGPDQDIDNPLGVGGPSLHGWALSTRTFQKNVFGSDGGVSVIQQCLRQRLIDEMHIAISPVLLGAGERRFEGVNLPALGYACTRHASSPLATHVVFARQ